ncbi:Biotin-lipoyl like [Caloramator fervidus]|uniref:Biotin-lipoyl like n=1 Tax=Caloramator fervidus TaxID=29344 RepID=A0A1H5TNR1_9CLOT|nr:efflux RND transporter periplasmic adaptor subunit [Caloramator fervidus]SEF63741.1 Biotin-lipoyl like [Caloramator fervidus]
MKKAKSILISILLLLLIGAGVGLYFYFYNDSHYITTDNAQVSAIMVSITPELTGKIEEWNIKEGDYVKSGQILGRQDVSALVSTSAINSQGLSSSADVIASKSYIKSPIDGKVVLSNAVVGQVVSPGMEIAQIIDLSNIFIKANIEETNISKIKEGQKVDIKIDAYPDKKFEGYVKTIGQATQSAFSSMPSLTTSGTYSKQTQYIPVKITIINNDNVVLMPGMNATVKIHIK